MTSKKYLQFEDRPQGLRAPAIICAFKGWNDASDAATSALRLLGSSLGATRFASFEPEPFYDFQVARPTIRLVDGQVESVVWPRIEMYYAYVPRAPRDLILVHGLEPSMRWPTLTSQLAELAETFGCQLAVTLGSLLADVPHTWPVPITAFASNASLVEGVRHSGLSYEGPTGIVGVLHQAFVQRGIPAASLWASVPHYIASVSSPKAALALVRTLERVIDVSVDASELEDATNEYERQIAKVIEHDPDLQKFIERLEQSSQQEQPDFPSPHNLPSGETLARDFQRFLKQRGDFRE